MFFSKILFLVLLLSLQTSCSSTPVQWLDVFSSEKRVASHVLPRSEALLRKTMVSDVNYELYFHLDSKEKKYFGENLITFTLTKKEAPLTIDFTGGKVALLRINGKAETDIQYNGFFLEIPEEKLQLGKNQVFIRFEHSYSSDGSGLHRFKDPKDKRVYLYSDFEPFDANKMFPCFDQPDLKAIFNLSVKVPKDWTVISTTREISKSKPAKDKVFWVFRKTPKISTYVFSLHAGPYKAWHSKYGNIKLRLFARRSFARHIDDHDWFYVTRKGLKFYQNFFDIPYPFKKLDQVIVPEFNAGAMENAGAVTFSEHLISLGIPTLKQREIKANVILHELAHMWFGDLVTMKWWNDLWLNESFATYMASLSLRELPEFKNSWSSFFADKKLWAYWEDRLPTTHPIEVTVNDTNEAFSNFDGITYGKGASVLKQLSFFIGHSAFRAGVRDYLRAYSYENAELSDFFYYLERAAKIDLHSWIDGWLRTSGVSQVKVTPECRNGKLKALYIEQLKTKSDGELRSHRSELGIFRNFKLHKSAPLTYAAKTSQITDLDELKLAGVRCPDFVYLNLNDHDFVLQEFQAQDWSEIEKALQQAFKGNSTEDRLLAMMLLEELWRVVRNGKVSAGRFWNVLKNQILMETEPKLLGHLFNYVAGSRRRAGSLAYYFMMAGNKPAQAYYEEMEVVLWKKFEASKKHPEILRLTMDALLEIAQSPVSMKKLLGLLKNRTTVRGFKMDLERRWKALIRLSSVDHSEASELIKDEVKKDSSDFSEQMHLASQAVRPVSHEKEKWLKLLGEKDSQYSLAKQKTIMTYLFPYWQKKFLRQFREKILDLLLTANQSKDAEFLERFSIALAPKACSSESQEMLQEFLSDHGSDLHPIVKKNFENARYEDERCIEIKKALLAE